MYYWARLRQNIKKCFGPINRFMNICGNKYVAYVPLPGAEEKDVQVVWEVNHHISVNTELIKTIPLPAPFTDQVKVPMYYHHMIELPPGAQKDNVQQTWHRGLLIFTYIQDIQ